MREIHGRKAGFLAAAGFALATAACGSGGGGGGGGEPGPTTATPELVSLTSEGGANLGGNPVGGITVSAAATFADGSFVRVGTFTEWAMFGLGEPNERWLDFHYPPGMYISRHDPDGTLAWVRLCFTNSRDPAPPSDVIAMPDGSAIFTGRRADPMHFEETQPGGLFVLDRGDFGSYTACYDASGTLRYARESLSAAWDARLVSVRGGAEYGMVVDVMDEIGIAADEVSHPGFQLKYHRLSVLARFRSDTGDFVDWTLLDAGADMFASVDCSTTDGGFAVGGDYSDPGFFGLHAPDGEKDSHLLRFDVDAKLAWTTRISSPTFETLEGVAGTPGGGVVATGLYIDSCTFTGATRTLTLSASPPTTTHALMYLLRPASRYLCAYDAAGEPLWARTVALSSGERTSVRFAAAADGSLALVDTHANAQTLDPEGAAHAVPAADFGTRDTLFVRWSPTGVLRGVGRLVGDEMSVGAGLCAQPGGDWLVFTTGAGPATYDPAGPHTASAPLLGLESTFTLRLRTP